MPPVPMTSEYSPTHDPCHNEENQKKILRVVNADEEEEDEVSSVVLSEGDAEAESSTKSITARCEGCGTGLDADEEDINCERCKDVLVKIARGFPGFMPSSHSVHDGEVMNTCAGCFEPKLNPKAAEIYCTGCKDSLLRSIALEKTFLIETANLESPAETDEDPNSCPSMSGNEDTSADRSGEYPYEFSVSQILNPTASEVQSQPTGLEYRLKPPRLAHFVTGKVPTILQDIRFASPVTNCARLAPTSSKWAFQPCISCQTNSLLCDAAVPSCTQCKSTDVICTYRHLTNPGKTKPVRFDEVPRTCFACFESNVRIQISGRCGPCDAKTRLKENWKADISDSGNATASSSSQVEESKSELPRFLASLETQLQNTRLGNYPQQPRIPTQPITRIGVQGDATRQILPPTQDLIQIPPVLPSETTTTPLPGFSTPCLACFDRVPCPAHPKLTSNPASLFITPYKLLSIRPRYRASTASESRLQCSPLASAIPCLACFDETVCAYHVKSGWNEKAATACGSCRLAGLECDEAKPGCTACVKRGVECLYITGDMKSESDDVTPALEPKPTAEPLPTPVLTSSSTSSDPPPSPTPRACGSCRFSKSQCDETRPGCLVCKEKGLDCLYLSSTTPAPSNPPPVSTAVQTKDKAEDIHKDDDEDDINKITSSRKLNSSVIFHPTTTETESHSVNCFQELQLDDSIILTVAAVDRDEHNDIKEASISDLGGAGMEDSVLQGDDTAVEEEAQESASESEDWDVVSSNEEYEVIDA